MVNHCIDKSSNGPLLPPAYVVRGKVIFILGNVCLFTIGWGGGTPNSDLGGGYPFPGLGGGGTPSQVWTGGGYPISGLDGGGGGVSQPGLDDGVPCPPPTCIASTCYAASGMPLAFTQEDFIIIIIFEKCDTYKLVFAWINLICGKCFENFLADIRVM